jgi:two-component system, NtrC family, response regulator AtoC
VHKNIGRVTRSVTPMCTDLSHSSRIDAAELPSEEVIFGSTAAMQEVRKQIDKALCENLPVLIQGESGTGKEVIAKYLHIRSGSSEAPFVKVSCIALPARLQGSDSQLRCAGTLYLDEFGDMDSTSQEELIHSFSRRGADRSSLLGRLAEIRIVCSLRTRREAVVAETAFDCKEGGGLLRVNLPPLRERKADLPQLCEFLMQKQARRFGKSPQHLTPHTLTLLKKWHWPGNLRELENWIARVVILGSQETLAAELRNHAEPDYSTDEVDAFSGTRQVSSLATQTAILKALQTHGWSRRRAAQELRMSYRALICRLREANVPRRRRSHREFPPAS